MKKIMLMLVTFLSLTCLAKNESKPALNAQDTLKINSEILFIGCIDTVQDRALLLSSTIRTKKLSTKYVVIMLPPYSTPTVTYRRLVVNTLKKEKSR